MDRKGRVQWRKLIIQDLTQNSGKSCHAFPAQGGMIGDLDGRALDRLSGFGLFYPSVRQSIL